LNILPSRAECYGLVLCEANSFGVPCLTTSVGGISTIVKDDVNGRMFSTESSVSEYCSYILGLLSHRERYRQLAISSFNEYNVRLTPASSMKAIRELLYEFCTQ